MTADTTALQERIARVLHEVDPISGHGHDWRKLSDAERKFYTRKAAAVLPIIAAEVQAAKAEALREMQEHHEREADKAQTITARGIHLTIADGARKRATEYETGDSDEHR